MLRAVLLSSAFVFTGCEFLAPSAPDDGPTSRRPTGDEGEGEGEGEEGEGEEGEGEGEVEPPPDTPPDPQGPRILSLALSVERVDDRSTATLTAVVSDPDGLDDIIGPLIIEPLSGATLGALTPTAAGTYTTNLSWDTFAGVAPVEFVRGGDTRFVRVQFSDLAGHQVTGTVELGVFCNDDMPACANTCGAVRCAGACEAVSDAVSDDDLCTSCNEGCASCASDCACFPDAPACNGSDCVATLDYFEELTGAACLVDEGITLRSDRFLEWHLSGVRHGVLLDEMPLPIGFSAQQLGEVLCAELGGVRRIGQARYPAGFEPEHIVVTVGEGCTAANLAACVPVRRPHVPPGNTDSGTFVACNDNGPDYGGFGQPCDPHNSECDDSESVCEQSSRTCVYYCFGSDDTCAECDLATGRDCVCNPDTIKCE